MCKKRRNRKEVRSRGVGFFLIYMCVEKSQTRHLYQLLFWSFVMSAYAMGDRKENSKLMFSSVST